MTGKGASSVPFLSLWERAGVRVLGVAAGIALSFPFSAVAQDLEPAQFIPDDGAQPIAQIIASDSEPTPAAPTSAAPLRWKSKPATVTNVAVNEATPLPAPKMAAAPSPAPSRGWNRTRIDGQVRPAQAVSDPFRDPFGDRSATRQAADIELLPAGEPVAEEPPHVASKPSYELLPAPSPLRTVPSTRAPAELEPTLVAQPGNPPPVGSPIPESPLPSITEPTPRSGTPCNRVYNERNCCDIETGCQLFREQLRNDSIRNISLDITPRFMPDLTKVEDEEQRAEKLRHLESRTWRSKSGEVLATGRMTNLERSRVIVTDDSGAEVARIPWNQLGDDELCYINAWWRLPVECGLGGREIASRHWIPATFAYTASSLCHKPLYFEQVQLERYGHTAGPIRQPLISGAHFFVSLMALPYNMAISPPHECEYALGYYRPGSCAPWMIPPVPLSVRGAVAETAFVVGGIYLIP
ncbi:MAG: hypothetical protein SFU86_10320 [Pirellulaceae bacterium]|nr:hypothetical protein [Pirellulaceae bacterium]